MKLYNTLTRKTEVFKPLRDDAARIYSCGPTVYDQAHIGNLSAYVFADTLRRVLQASGYNVEHVMNYTDVDDKTIGRSHERYPHAEPHQALRELTDQYIALFLDDLSAVSVDTRAINFVRATDHIEQMKQLIAALYKAGVAYLADDGVYFSIEAYRKTGKTYGQLLELTSANTSEARIQNDEYDKESVHDFALWKVQKSDEPAWEFKLGDRDLTGRPGWHIECSAMSKKHLGQPFDIHTGGVDLIFPHHENEIAQSTALESSPVMAQIFAHNEHILVDGRKMSKSLGNFYTLADVEKRDFLPVAFRLKVLQSHYRSQVNFTWESLEAAQNLLLKLYAWADLKHQSNAYQESASKNYKKQLETILHEVQNDLGTPQALRVISDMAEQGESVGVDPQKIQPLLNVLDRIFGFNLAERPDISSEQKQLIADRQQARIAKDWEKSDLLRDKLAHLGIAVRDTDLGTIWYRIKA